MKKKIIVLLVLAVLLVTGCTGKEVNNKKNTEDKEAKAVTSLSGKYLMTEPSRKGYLEQGFDKTITVEGENVILYDDYDQSTYTGTYEIKDGKVTFHFTHFKGYSEDQSHSPVDKEVEYKLIGKANSKKITLTTEMTGTKKKVIEEVYEPVKETK